MLFYCQNIFKNVIFKGTALNNGKNLNDLVYKTIIISVRSDNGRHTERVMDDKERIWSGIEKAFKACSHVLIYSF